MTSSNLEPNATPKTFLEESRLSHLSEVSAASHDHGTIQVEGATQHNLRSVNLCLPRNQLIVFTGPSGCGKSSLVFSTLHAEGQRQYLETLSHQARSLLKQLPRAKVLRINGLPPTLAVDQHQPARNPRSTVGTLTEIVDYLRVLFARVGVPGCPHCGPGMRPASPGKILARIENLPEGTRLMLLAPLLPRKGGTVSAAVSEVRQAGLLRLRVQGEIVDLDQWAGALSEDHQTAAEAGTLQLEAVVDRLVVRPGGQARAAESLQLALKLGRGGVTLLYQAPAGAGVKSHTSQVAQRATSLGEELPWHAEAFSTQPVCAGCGGPYAVLEPRNFSFNSPHGACPDCQGMGQAARYAPELLISNPTRGLFKGGVEILSQAPAKRLREYQVWAEQVYARHAQALETPLQDVSVTCLQELWHGTADGSGLGLLNRLLQEASSTTDEDRLEQLLTGQQLLNCPACDGSRLNSAARCVRVQGVGLADLTSWELADLHSWLQGIAWSTEESPIAAPLTAAVLRRLSFLLDVGLHYLTLQRGVDTLSGGEYQRARLAAAVSSGLVNVCYVLDEPTLGLHHQDCQKLIQILLKLKAAGNTVLVVEHDSQVMRAADLLVDMGPGAGERGGRVLSVAPPAELLQPASLTESEVPGTTADYLSGRKQLARTRPRGNPEAGPALVLTDCRGRNLCGITARFPLRHLIAVTGPSGSGKTTLVNETLAPAVRRALHGWGAEPAKHAGLEGHTGIRQLVQVDQYPLGRSPRGNTATYCGAFDEIRKLFAATKAAKAQGWGSSRFSFNASGGRCETCHGLGTVRIRMNFLPDAYMICRECHGARFNAETLTVRFKGLSIADVLELSVEQAAEVFSEFHKLAEKFRWLLHVGLGYLRLGQPSSSLSGGEGQRLKLATELALGGSQPTLYLLDEPTTGLHFVDVALLLKVFEALVEQGHTVVMVEHHQELIQGADWVLDLGPGGGKHGGALVYSGPPR